MSPYLENFQKDDNSEDTLLTYKSMLSALSDGELDGNELDTLLGFLSNDTQEAFELHRYWKHIHICKNSLRHENHMMVNQDLHELIRSQLPVNTQKQNVLAFGQIKTREKPRANNHFSFVQNLGIAASVMFAVVFTWVGAQAPVRENVLAFFQSESSVEEYKTASKLSEIPAFSQNFPQLVQRQKQFSHQVVAGTGSQNAQNANRLSKQQRPVYLSQDRLNSYMRLHASNASLNSNQGIIPFARLSADQQLTNF